MATRVFSRLLSAIILGISLGALSACDAIRVSRLGRSKYVEQATNAAHAQFTDTDTELMALLVLGFVCVLAAVMVFGLYELLAFSIYKVLARLDKKVAHEITSS
ncbi:MAG: hypothetical protein QM813_22710 [Verrucomicrobiota bacterium]